MKDIAYRSIFPNNNVPAPVFNFKNTTLKEQLQIETTSLLSRVDFSVLSAKIHELEFKVEIETDPVNALLNQLKEKSIY